MESQKRNSWLTFWLYAALIALGFTLALPLSFIAGLISAGDDAPAWVQAIGSVVAIFVAVIVPMVIHSRDRAMTQEREALKARGFALVVLPLAEQFLMHLRSAKKIVDEETEDFPDFEEASRVAVVPEELTKLVEELHVLGEPGAKLQNAIAHSWIARQDLEYMDLYHRYGGEYDRHNGEAPEELPEPNDPGKALDGAIFRLTSAVQAMNEMFD